MKTKVFQFYLNNVKPYSDKIPYFRELAEIVWRVIWKLRLTLKSIWLSVDLKKIYWINPQKIIYGLARGALIVPEYKEQEKIWRDHQTGLCNFSSKKKGHRMDK